MPSFAPNATHRFIATYVSAGVQHTLTVRRARSETLPGAANSAAAFVTAVFAALNPRLPTDVAFTAALWIPKDTDIGIPGPLPTAPAGTTDPADYTPLMKIKALTLSGKDGNGHKGHFSIFGCLFPQEDPVTDTDAADGVILSAEDAAVAAFIAAANGGSRTYSIADSPLTFHERATFKENDHLLRLVRRGIIS